MHSLPPSQKPPGSALADTGWLLPEWSVPLWGVGAVMTDRRMPAGVPGGSAAPYEHFNLGDHVGDDPDVVARHRRDLAARLPATPVWLQQVHGHRVVRLSRSVPAPAPALTPAIEAGREDGVLVGGHPWHEGAPAPVADGSWTTEPGLACAVMVADCLPVLLAAPQSQGVAALHAGWRGLAGAGAGMQGQGVLEVGVAALCEGTGCAPAELQAWLGPCIGPQAFEVGEDVLRGFGVDPDHPSPPAFKPQGNPTGGGRKWLADLPALARRRLALLGVVQVAGGHWCTVSDSARFFSFRRDGRCGRQAACIWIESGR